MGAHDGWVRATTDLEVANVAPHGAQRRLRRLLWLRFIDPEHLQEPRDQRLDEVQVALDCPNDRVDVAAQDLLGETEREALRGMSGYV